MIIQRRKHERTSPRNNPPEPEWLSFSRALIPRRVMVGDNLDHRREPDLNRPKEKDHQRLQTQLKQYEEHALHLLQTHRAELDQIADELDLKRELGFEELRPRHDQILKAK